MTQKLKDLLDGSVIGMVHLLPLPGVPKHPGMKGLVDAACADAEALLEGGVDALLIENMHDFPCVAEHHMGPEVAAAMTRAAVEIRRNTDKNLAIGIQVLFAANRTAVAIAQAADLDFIRAEGWTYGHLSDKGWAQASAGRTVRYRESMGATDISVFADIKKKHAAHAVTADLTIADIAANLELHKVDATIVTGTTTGRPPDLDDLRAVRGATKLPMIIGSGMAADNVSDYRDLCDAMIVGSTLKEQGDWRRPVELERVRRFVDALRG